MTKNKPLYTIVFEDKSVFVGGDSYFETKWLDIPDKKIINLIYKLPTGDYLMLPKYDKYYHMVEAVSDINGTNAKKVTLEFIYIMGQISNTVVIYKINLKNNEYLVTQSIKTIDDKFVTGLNKQGWK